MSLLATFFTLFAVVQAFTINTPSGWSNNNQNVTITWSSVASDANTFSVELTNPDPAFLYNQPLAIATTLNKADGSYNLRLPFVPAGDGYTLQFVNVSDISNVYATSGSFSIANTTTSTSSSSASTTSTASGSGNTTTAPSAQTTTQAGSANKVGPAAALAVALVALGFSTLGF